MTDTELLQAIGNLIDEKLDKKLDEKLQPIMDDISDIKEKLNDIDDAVGIIAEWADKAADVTRIPFVAGNAINN